MSIEKDRFGEPYVVCDGGCRAVTTIAGIHSASVGWYAVTNFKAPRQVRGVGVGVGEVPSLAATHWCATCAAVIFDMLKERGLMK